MSAIYMNEYNRKIQVVGNRTYAISLPKRWVQINKLEKNNEVHILEKGDTLIINPTKKKEYQELKNVDIEEINLTQSIILLAYTKGIKKLNLNFKTKDNYLSAKPLILEILSYLEGYKIINESNNQVLITDSYIEYNIYVRDIAKRMCIIINDMRDCILNGKKETKHILEKESDSLYHFSKRILYLCCINSEFMEKNQIQDMEEIFLWRLIFKKLENISDVLEKTGKKHMYNEEISLIFNSLNDVLIFNKKLNVNKITELKKINLSQPSHIRIKELIIDILNNLLLIRLNKEVFD